ncbi:MAG: LLM class F420-dependent oxidoreductase [Tepidiformaceae bacterium]
MKVGIGMFVTGYTVDAVTLARKVEDGGFSSIWVPDHTVLPVGPETKYPAGGEIPTLYGEMADPFVLLSFIGAVTTKLRLATGIILVPERHPLTLAKTASTLDNFSNGRLILGVGTGWLREETELYGTDFDTRWQYTREAVLAMKGLWKDKDGTAAYDGKYVSFPAVRCDPLSVQRSGPPVVIGAPGSDTTVKRIVGWGDGWLPVMPTPEEVRRVRKAIEARCAEVGRDPSEISIHVYVMDVTPSTQRAYEDAGADEIVIGIYNHPGTPLPYDQWAPQRGLALQGGRPPPAETLAVLDKIHAQAQL